jgi:uncharacterized protein (TIGR03437 family)
VTTTQPALTGGAAVTLASNNTLLTVPASVTVTAGATTATFTATAAASIPANQTATVTATLGPSTQTASLNLQAPVLLSGVLCNPASLGQSAIATCTVTTTQPALTGGAAVTLASNNTLLTVPASVTVAAGATTATFSATAAATIPANQTAIVTATSGPSTASASVTLISSGTATFLTLDTTTQGNWQTKFGKNGYNVINSAVSYPTYGTVTPSGQSSYTWTASSTDIRALTQTPTSGNRIAAGWYSAASFTIDLTFTDTAQHQVALYVLDWDNQSRAETVQVLDANQNLLDTRNAVNFGAGQYLVWQLSGHVHLQITGTAGPNAVASGLFFDTPSPVAVPGCSPSGIAQNASARCTVTLGQVAPGGGSIVMLSSNTSLLSVPATVTVEGGTTTAAFTATTATIPSSQTATITASLGSSSASAAVNLVASTGAATFLTLDTTTQGNWQNKYGKGGYNVINSAVSYPGYVSVTPSGGTGAYTWAASTTDVRGLNQAPAGTGRIAATWYSSASFAIDLAFADSAQHQVALYLLDWDSTSRAETLQIVDANNKVLDTRSATGFHNGQYFVWQLSGHVRIQIAMTSGSNGVVSGLFFDTVASTSTTGQAVLSRNQLPENTNGLSAYAKPDPVLAGTASISSIRCSNGVLAAGGTTTCELQVHPAPRPVTISLTSSSSAVHVPAVVTTRSNQSALTFRVQADPAASHQQVTITAAVGAVTTESTLVVVGAFDPIIDAPKQVIGNAGSTVSFSVTATDHSGLPPAIQTSELPAGAVFNSTSGVFEWTPGSSQRGKYQIEFTASNPAGQSSRAQVDLEVDSGVPVLNPPSYSCSPGALAALTGKWLAAPGAPLSDPAGSASGLGGTRLLVDRHSVPIVSVSTDRVDFICPATAAGSQITVEAESVFGASRPVSMGTQTATPTILSYGDTLANQGLISFVGTTDLVMARNYSVSGHPAQPGDQIAVYVTGLGSTEVLNASAIVVQLGEVPVAVQSVQPVPGRPGLYAIEIQTPPGVPVGVVPVRLQMIAPGGQQFVSNSVSAEFEAVR